MEAPKQVHGAKNMPSFIKHPDSYSFVNVSHITYLKQQDEKSIWFQMVGIDHYYTWKFTDKAKTEEFLKSFEEKSVQKDENKEIEELVKYTSDKFLQILSSLK